MRSLGKITVFFMILILTSCSEEHYPRIKYQKDLAMTVNIKDMTISFINLEKGEKLEEWELEKPYIGGLILPDGDRLLLYGKQLDTIDIYSLEKGKKITSWKTGQGIVSGRVLANQKELVFADQSLNAIRFFSLDGKELETVKTDNGPLTILEDNVEETLYIISYKSRSMSVFDTRNKKKLYSFPIHAEATGGLLRQKEGEIWIGGHGEGTEIETDIHVYDASSGSLLRTIPAPVMPINFSEKNDFVYVLSHGSNTLYKLNGTGREMTSKKVGANPFEMKMQNDKIIIAGYDSNDVHLLNDETLEIESTIPVGKGPFQLILREGVDDESY